MPRHSDSGQIDLAEVFRRVQLEMLAQLSVGRLFEHASAAGHATEHHWLEMFHRYLPQRYRAAPAFVIDSSGRRSRQIDIAIFDNLSSPPLFPHASGLHLPAESIYAVFEVKPTFSRQWLRDAGEKAASVRTLLRTRKMLAGLLATSSVWTPPTFSANLKTALATLPVAQRLDIGCSLEHGAFERIPSLRVSSPGESLVFFVLRLLERLRKLGPAPAANLMHYARGLRSFK